MYQLMTSLCMTIASPSRLSLDTLEESIPVMIIRAVTLRREWDNITDLSDDSEGPHLAQVNTDTQKSRKTNAI